MKLFKSLFLIAMSLIFIQCSKESRDVEGLKSVDKFAEQLVDITHSKIDKYNELSMQFEAPLISNYWGFIFPRGDSMSSNHEVLAFRASEEIIRVLENDFFGCQ